MQVRVPTYSKSQLKEPFLEWQMIGPEDSINRKLGKPKIAISLRGSDLSSAYSINILK